MGTPVTPQTPLSTARQRSEPYSSSSTGGGQTPNPGQQGQLQQQKSRESQGKPKVPHQIIREQSLEGFEVIPPGAVVRDIPQVQSNKQQETKIQVEINTSRQYPSYYRFLDTHKENKIIHFHFLYC